MLTKEFVIFENIKNAVKSINKRPSDITRVCNKQRKSAYGFYWEWCF